MLHAHHQQVAPNLAPYVSEQKSWAQRRRQYADAMSGDWFGFIAQSGTSDVGYLICKKRPMDWEAAFDLPPMLWELLTLFVHPKYRGAGIGSAMLDAMDETIASTKISTKLVGVIPDNHRAVALYQARGYIPTWLIMTRFKRQLVATETRQDVSIVGASIDSVDTLQPLWTTLHHHHQDVSPHLGPWVDDVRAWSVIRKLLVNSAADGLLFVAHSGGTPIGLASAAIYNADELGYADTWLTGNRIAETKFLVVADEARGQGVGATLLRTVDCELARRGTHDHLIGVIEPNLDAIRFYQSKEFRPAWLELVQA